MRRFFIISLIFVLFVSLLTSQIPDTLAAKLQAELAKYLSSSDKGLQAAVIIHDVGTWTGNAGISYSTVPINSAMRFALGSISKIYTTAAIFLLSERGELTINDKVSKWCPNLVGAKINGNITLVQLMNHTSGLGEIAMDSCVTNQGRNWTLEEVIGTIDSPMFNPGASCYYCNANFILAGLVIEAATNDKVENFFRPQILNQLNLADTFYSARETVTGAWAHGWSGNTDISSMNRTCINSFSSSAGCFVATARDVAQFFDSLLNYKLLTPASIANMKSKTSPSIYGNGAFEFVANGGRTLTSKEGQIDGFLSIVVHDPAINTSICVLANNENSSSTLKCAKALDTVVFNNFPTVPTKDVFVAGFSGSGLWSWNPNSASWSQWNSQEALALAVGDVDGNGREDVVGAYVSGPWIRLDSGSWQKIEGVGNPQMLACGDLNADGKDDVIGVWPGLGVWVRTSGSNAWTRWHEKDALMVDAGDFDKDGKDDFLGVWKPEGVWVKYAAGAWNKILDSTDLLYLASGDLNGDARSDLLGSWTHGVWHYNFNGGVWTRLYDSAERTRAGDLDGDGQDDLLGTWNNVAGVWVRYSKDGSWYKIHGIKPLSFAAGKL